jgi:predicted nucleotidyltransferase
MVVVILVNLLIMKPVRYPYVNNPLGFKLPEVKPVVHPIIYQWDDLPEDQKEELQTIKNTIISIIGECQISLYGSIVKGYWDEDSDYDLTIHKGMSKETLGILRSQSYPRSVGINIGLRNFTPEPGKNILI